MNKWYKILNFKGKSNFLISLIIDNSYKIRYAVINNDKSKIFIIPDNILSLTVVKDIWFFSKKNSFLKLLLSNYKYMYLTSYIVYSLKIEIVGIGYKLMLNNNYIYILVGYTHLIKIKIPKNIEVNITNKIMSITYSNKYILGNIYNRLSKIKKIDVYKGKGLKRVYDKLNLKTSKSKIIKK